MAKIKECCNGQMANVGLFVLLTWHILENVCIAHMENLVGIFCSAHTKKIHNNNKYDNLHKKVIDLGKKRNNSLSLMRSSQADQLTHQG